MNEFCVLVGPTAKTRKGVSFGHVKNLLGFVEPRWFGERISSGLSSGEGLIWAVRDAIPGKTPDPGVSDKRLLVVEPEFASTLVNFGRSGNNLSAKLREAWDGLDVLQSLTKNSIAKARRPHISVVGHITNGELRRLLTSTEAGNGFANRFLWVCASRSKFLPHGGHLTEEDLIEIRQEISAAVAVAKNIELIERDEEARVLWHDVYRSLSEELPGLLGAVTSRAEAHVMRLSCLYALLDGSPLVRVEHLRAALALWDYSFASARFIFGDALGDETADEILRALKRHPRGMTRTDISALFKRNQAATKIGRALGELVERGLVRFEHEQSGGRPIERWFALTARLAGPKDLIR